MNKALTEVLLKLLPTAISAGYAKVLFSEPNRPFGITLLYFYTMFGNNDPIEKENSRMSMLAAWDGLYCATLRKRSEDGCACAAFADVPLRNAQAIDTLVAVILHSGLYVTASELWPDLPATQRATITQSLDW